MTKPNSHFSVLFVDVAHPGEKRKDYMSLEVATEDESKGPVVMERDEQTKVHHFIPVSVRLCTFIFTCICLRESLNVNIKMYHN